MPDSTDAELIAELRAAHNRADLRLYETYTDTHPTHGILTDERELPDELARLLSLAESALTARADALREAAEIAADLREADVERAILARIQEKNDG